MLFESMSSASALSRRKFKYNEFLIKFMVGKEKKITPKDLERFYVNVDALCEEIFDASLKSYECDENVSESSMRS